MSREDWRRAARRVADRATHDSVTADLLAGTGRFSNEFYLYDRPAVAHLDDGEQPHVAFYNEIKGIGVDSKRNTRSPDEGGITVMLFTDRRVLAVIGRRGGDERLTVPYGVVTGADYATGIMKHRVVVETVDDDYHFWVDSGYTEDDLRDAVELVRSNASGGRASPRSTGTGTGADAGTASGAVSSDGGADPDSGAGTEPTGGTGASGAGTDAGPAAGGTGTGGGGRTGGPGTGGGPSGGRTGGGSTGDGGSDGDPLEKLERLEELNEKGIVDDEEFQRKKRELLDQI